MSITVVWLQGLQIWSAEDAITHFSFWGSPAHIWTVWLWVPLRCAASTWSSSFAARLAIQKTCLQLHALFYVTVSRLDCVEGYGEAETTRRHRPWYFNDVVAHLSAGVDCRTVQYYEHLVVPVSEILQKCNHALGIRLLMELHVKREHMLTRFTYLV